MLTSSTQGEGRSQDRIELLKQLLKQKGIAARRVPQIKKRTGPGPYPLSFAQQRLWLLYQLKPDSPDNNLFNGVRLRGKLNKATLDITISEIVRRHEALRTTFTTVDGVPVQVINPTKQMAIELIDISEVDEGEREMEARRLATQESRRAFDLATGPLLRVALLKLSEDEQVVLFTWPHIVSDEWSMGVLMREVRELYEATSEGRRAGLEELEIQYADYAVWQREWMSGEVLEEQLGYWKKQLSGARSVIDLPTDKLRPAQETFQGESHSFAIAPELAATLRALAEQEGATLYMLFLAAFKTLLCRYTHQEDLIVGSPIANRNRGEIEGLIGFFVNTLILRTDLSGNPSFRELLRRVRKTTLDAYDYQDLPFDKLIESLNPERTGDSFPLFPVLFGLHNIIDQPLDLPGLIVSSVRTDEKTVRVDLNLEIFEAQNAVSAAISYKTDLFEPETIARMAAHLQNLLTGIAENPDRSIYDLPLMSEEEIERITVEWNETKTLYDTSLCVHELFEQQAERAPGVIAVICQQQQLTFKDLNCMANKLAHRLKALGVGPDERVGIYMERATEAVTAILGTLKAGGAYLPLDTAYPIDRVLLTLEDARVRVVLTQERFLNSLAAFSGQVICLDSDVKSFAEESDENPINTAQPENLAYVIYTSGSSGKPKGVMVPHRGVVNYLNWSRERYGGSGLKGAPVHSSMSFDLTVTSLFTPLVSGSSVTLINEEGGVDALTEDLKRGSDYSLLKITPAHLSILNQLIPAEQMARAARAIVIGGEALFGQSLKPWQTHAPKTRLINEYGPTEAVVGCCVYEVPGAQPISDAVLIGRPIANMQLYLMDACLCPVPVGVTGEIYIGGEGLARGYINRPDMTAERFIPNSFSTQPGARLYKTGDIGRYLPDGNIEFVGRNDSQVKIRGFRVELGEVEAAIIEHAQVRDAVVMLREGSEGDSRLVAYVVTEPELTISTSELRRFLTEKLPDYMLPSTFVFLDEMPLTPNGKVNRNSLSEPDNLRPDLVSSFIAPRTPVEKELAQIWRELLKVEEVGIRDNFFELGGHSILLTQLASRISKSFGIENPLRALFDTPTIADMTKAVVGIQARQEDSAEIARMLEEIRHLSSDELWALLEAENNEAEKPQSVSDNKPQASAAAKRTSPDEAEILELLGDLTREQTALLILRLKQKPGAKSVNENKIPPIRRVSRDQDLPLSFAQQRLWFLHQLDPDSIAFNQPEAIRLRGKLNKRAFDITISEIVRRHEPLRTTFTTVDGVPVQVINPTKQMAIELIDISEVDEGEREAEARRLATQESRRAFDLATGPLLRVTLVKLGEDDHAIFFTTHHIVSDGWSMGVLMREVSELYGAVCEGRQPALEELEIQYADYAVWQREWMSGEVLEEQLGYWKKQLSGARSVIDLPTDKPRPQDQNLAGGSCSILLQADLVEKLKRLSNQENVTLFMTLLAAFQTLLYRYSEQETILIGTPIAGRNRVEVEGLIGFFINTLVLRADISNDMSFRELLGQTREVTLGAYAHQDLPFEKLVEVMQPERSASHSPFFQVFFALHNVPGSPLELPGLTLSPLFGEFEVARYDLAFYLEEIGEQVLADMHYSPDMFETATIERMLAQFLTLLEAIVTAPEKSVSRLPLSTAAQRQQLLSEFNQATA
jgi:amino acid adenylation domain-containing protein